MKQAWYQAFLHSKVRAIKASLYKHLWRVGAYQWPRDISLWKGGWIVALVSVQLVVSSSLTVWVKWCLLPRTVITFRFKIPACTSTCVGKIRDIGITFMKTSKPNSTCILLEIGEQVDHHESAQWRVISLCFGAQTCFPPWLVGCVSWGGNLSLHGRAEGCRLS